MDSADLQKRFHLGEAPDEDLRIVLAFHFDRAREVEGRRVEYLRGEAVALTAVYQRGGRLDRLEPGMVLTGADVDTIASTIERNALGGLDTQVYREPCFAFAPVEGGWRYAERFQILPPPDDAPTPNWVSNDWPFVLEIACEVPPDPASTVGFARVQRERRKTRLLLSALVPWITDRSPTYAPGRQQWAQSVDGEPATGTRWTQAGYHPEGWVYRRPDFSPPAESLLPTTSDQVVYSRRTYSGDEKLDLPESFNEFVGQFYALDPERQARFLMWAYWLNHAKLMGGLSDSASYMALVQAIEALMPARSGGHRCTACGKLTGPGLREQFVAFLERFAPPHPDEPGTERDALYHLRSKLSHGGGLLIAEESQAFGDFYPKANAERNRVWIAGLLVRLAGISWLAQDGD
jgi:hypothetical protein